MAISPTPMERLAYRPLRKVLPSSKPPQLNAYQPMTTGDASFAVMNSSKTKNNSATQCKVKAMRATKMSGTLEYLSDGLQDQSWSVDLTVALECLCRSSCTWTHLESNCSLGAIGTGCEDAAIRQADNGRQIDRSQVW